ncbi:MAG: ATP-binding protein [Cyanobacteria bacterium J06627_15]
MTATLSRASWHNANQRHLSRALSQIRQALMRQGAETEGLDRDIGNDFTAVEDFDKADQSPFALDLLCRCFGLNAFERSILLLCAGMELEGQWSELCLAASGSAHPTFGLGLSLFSTPTWESLTPSAALRRWQLIEVGGGNALTTSPLRIDERILHYLAGVQYIDQRLQTLMTPVYERGLLVPSHERLIDTIEEAWTQRQPTSQTGPLPVIQLVGDDETSLRTVAVAACRRLGLALQELPVEALPSDWQQLRTLQMLCEREYSLSGTAILLSYEGTAIGGKERQGAIANFIDTVNLPLMIATPDRRRQRQRPIISLEISRPTPSEQRQLWHMGLDADLAISPNQITALVSQFNLSPSNIQSVCLQGQAAADPDMLWTLCRRQARPRLDELAQRIEARATWDSLVLPEKEQQILQTLSAHVAQRACVYEDWGFGNQSGRGLGISALFSGASGTGKTTAAEVISRDLDLDLYRVDLSAIVSKYIGETEKNLRRIFDAAEGGGVILLFDEADSLFGKRSDVSDSKDRYANMEVSYLLQRMESYRGLAILTTNLKNSMDQAFLRRLRFVVQFPFPDAKQRAEIWRRVFPAKTPTEGLVYERLAKLSIAGGNIRNIALNAAFIAADAGEPVKMQHLLQAAKQEYLKLERPLTDAEVKGWV